MGDSFGELPLHLVSYQVDKGQVQQAAEGLERGKATLRGAWPPEFS